MLLITQTGIYKTYGEAAFIDRKPTKKFTFKDR